MYKEATQSIYIANRAKYYQIYARFNRTDGLMIGDLVRLAGMDIGRVVNAKLDDNFKAILTLEIKDSVLIRNGFDVKWSSIGKLYQAYKKIHKIKIE